MEVEHHEVRTNGIRLHVVTAGPEAGTPVLMLHGFPEYWGGWSRQLGPLAEAGYRLIVPDQRGYNTSDKPPRVRDYRIRNLVDDALGVLDHFGAERAHVVCHDWGGVIGWWLVLDHPDRVDRFAVLNMPELRVMRRAMATSRQLRNSWYIFFFQLPWLAERALGRDDFARLVRTLYANTATKPFTDDELDGYRRAWAQPGALRAMLAWYRCVGRHPLDSPRAQRSDRPGLVIWGTRDTALSWKMAAPSARLLRDARLVLLDDAAHFVQHDAPDRVNAELLAFLGATPAPE